MVLAAAGAMALAAESLPGIVWPIDDRYPPAALFSPHVANLVWCVAIAVLYTLFQEHLVWIDHVKVDPIPLLFVAALLAFFCAFAGGIPMAGFVVSARAGDLGEIGATTRAFAGLVLWAGICGGIALPVIAFVIFVRRSMEKAERKAALAYWAVGLIVFGLLFSLTIYCRRGGDPRDWIGFALFVALCGVVGLFAGGLAQLLTRGKRAATQDAEAAE